MSIEFVDVDITEPLLKQDQDIATTTIFKICKAELQEMFVYDKTHDIDQAELPKLKVSKSLKMLQQLGGVENIARCIRTSLQDGINGDVDDIQRRQRCYGRNVYGRPKLKGYLHHLYDQFQSYLMIILLCMAVISIILGTLYKEGAEMTIGEAVYFYEAVSIFLAVLFVVVVNSYFQHFKDLKFQELVMRSRKSNVISIRGKYQHTLTVALEELVVGDVITLTAGQRIPADCLLIKKSPDFIVEEFLLNGVYTPMPKEAHTAKNYSENPNPFLFASSYVLGGVAVGLVCNVGDATYIGSRSEELNFEQNPTPTQKKLMKIRNTIEGYSRLVAVFVFLCLLFHMILAMLFLGAPVLDKQTIQQVTNHISTAVALMIVSIPDGLALSISLGIVFQLTEGTLYVMNMHAMEKIGGTQEIVISKSGILTQHEQGKVVNFFVEGKMYENDIENRFQGLDFYKAKDLIIQSILYNSKGGRVEMSEDAHLVTVGNFIDCALWNFLIQNDIEVPKEVKRTWNEKLAAYIPISLYRMRTTYAMFMEDEQGQMFVRVFCKGAPEIVLQLCSSIMEEGGDVNAFTEDLKVSYLDEVVLEYISKRGHKSIALAYKDMSTEEFNDMLVEKAGGASEEMFESLENDFTLLAVMGIEDKIRDDVKGLLKQCTEAKVNIRLVSNDDLFCTKTIAFQLGLINRYEYNDPNVCMEGHQLQEIVGGMRQLFNEQHEFEGVEVRKKIAFRLLSQKFKVIGRSTPDIKLMIVAGLMENNLVAVTCNDHQDMASITKADVGISNGRDLSNEMLRNKSDIVLLNESLENILLAIKQGRALYSNVKKFLQFQLTLNMVSLVVILFGSMVYGDPPLTPVHQLWLNIVIDTLGAISLCSEQPSDNILKYQGPLTRNQSIIDAGICRNFLICSIYQCVVLMVVLVFGRAIFDLEYENDTVIYDENWNPSDKLVHYTIIFNIMMFMTFFQQINSRKISNLEWNPFEGFFSNYIFLLILFLTFMFQLAMVQMGGSLTRCAPLSLYQHVVCLIIAMMVLVVGTIVKFIPEEYFSRIAHFFETETENFREDESDDEDVYYDMEILQKLAEAKTHEAKESKGDTKDSINQGPSGAPQGLKKRTTRTFERKNKPAQVQEYEQADIFDDPLGEEGKEPEAKPRQDYDEILSLVNALGGVEQQKSDLGTDRSDSNMAMLNTQKLDTDENKKDELDVDMNEDDYEYQLEYYDDEKAPGGENQPTGTLYHRRVRKK